MIRPLGGAGLAGFLFCGAPRNAATGSPYVIHVGLPLTGTAAFSGHNHQESLHVYEQLVNRTGGLYGRPLKFEFHDDQTSPVLAVQLTNGILPSRPTVILGSAI